MALSNTVQHYGGVTKAFHWMTALLVLTLIPLGIYANDLPYDTSEALAHKAWVFSLHKTLGITVFFVALARIFWALSQPKPALLHPDRKFESLLAETVHWLLYGSLLLVPLSGWLHHASTTGFAPIWWPLGQDLPLVPKSDSFAAATAGLHIVFERVLAIAILLHVAGALKHHFVDRDSTLRRMLPGSPAVPDTKGAHRVLLPLASAVTVWGLALLTGATLGLYQSHSGAVQSAALNEVQTDWVVEEGTIEIVVSQLGTDVAGQFADWTASISFDPTVNDGLAGSIDVTIAVGSLTLGSVTGQAMGEDFFNANNFPTARYTADLVKGADGYEAQGSLTLKDQTVPVSFPFALSISEGLARVQAQTTLDRRNYNVGTTSQPDEKNVGFNVGVGISLMARQTSE